MPTCLVVQHVAPEGPAVLAELLHAAGVTVEVLRVDEGDPIPVDAAGLAGLVVMGGPMSASGDDGFPSRRGELDLLRDTLAREVPVLGICLGAQLLAVAAGGRVFRGEAGAEVGWGSVKLTASAASDRLFASAPAQLPVLHWHGDTFDLPAAAIRLAGSERYPNQAFRIGPNAWGLQFHLEVDAAAVLTFAEVFADEARSAGTDPAEIAAATQATITEMTPARDVILGEFVRLVSAFPATPSKL
jgi:GMP synthase-like glutamine amidotransferase